MESDPERRSPPTPPASLAPRGWGIPRLGVTRLDRFPLVETGGDWSVPVATRSDLFSIVSVLDQRAPHGHSRLRLSSTPLNVSSTRELDVPQAGQSIRSSPTRSAGERSSPRARAASA